MKLQQRDACRQTNDGKGQSRDGRQEAERKQPAQEAEHEYGGRNQRAAQPFNRGPLPGHQRRDAHQKHQRQEHRHGGAVIVGRTDGDFIAGHQFRNHGEVRSPENREVDAQEQIGYAEEFGAGERRYEIKNI